MPELSLRKSLDRQIGKLQQDLLILGSLVAAATLQAVAALRKRDRPAAERIYAGDAQVNERRFRIEMDCLALIATQGPIARDLRILASVLEVNTELERIGDYAKGIARMAVDLERLTVIPFPEEMAAMAAICVDMLEQALAAFVAGDAAAARTIPERDDEVDDLYTAVSRRLIASITADGDLFDPANHLIWACRNLERMADRVTNICERTLFIESGELIELDL